MPTGSTWPIAIERKTGFSGSSSSPRWGSEDSNCCSAWSDICPWISGGMSALTRRGATYSMAGRLVIEARMTPGAGVFSAGTEAICLVIVVFPFPAYAAARRIACTGGAQASMEALTTLSGTPATRW